MRDKLVELIQNAVGGCARHWAELIADALVANGVTVQTTPISYERLLKLASKMHCWIFLYSFDEQGVYDELGFTEEENYILGYGGSFEVRPEPPKEGE